MYWVERQLDEAATEEALKEVGWGWFLTVDKCKSLQ
jgi:hypothetical protein